jgi:hypothetical protein
MSKSSFCPSNVSFRMKKMLVIVFMLQHALGYGQNPNFLGRFDASELGDQVLLSWQMIAGNVCQGIEIFRSADSTNFELIGYISGDCGNISEPVDFSYTDSNPVVNQKNYYRLTLGLLGESQVVSIDINNPGDRAILARPNPAWEKLVIDFRNLKNKKATLELFDPSGRLVYTDQTFGEQFQIPVIGFPEGNYTATISPEGEKKILTKVTIISN